MSKERAQKIKVILFDVDGVLTDGNIFLFPAPARGGAHGGSELSDAMEANAHAGGFAISSETMIESKGFNAHDGTAFSLARLSGLKTGIVTKRISEAVALRARDLRVDYVYQGQADKAATLDQILAQAGVTEEQVAYVGDDIVDLPIMRRCGLAIAVADARKQVKDIAHYVTEHAGGRGAGRDAVEYILECQGKLRSAIEAYLESRPAVQKSAQPESAGS